MKLTDLELKLLLRIPMTFELLHAKMLVENIGTDERRLAIANEAERLRFEMGC